MYQWFQVFIYFNYKRIHRIISQRKAVLCYQKKKKVMIFLLTHGQLRSRKVKSPFQYVISLVIFFCIFILAYYQRYYSCFFSFQIFIFIIDFSNLACTYSIYIICVFLLCQSLFYYCFILYLLALSISLVLLIFSMHYLILMFLFDALSC